MPMTSGEADAGDLQNKVAPVLGEPWSRGFLYPSQKVFVLKVMTHVEYDKDSWKEDCGCFEAPPFKPQTGSKSGSAKPMKRGT